MRRDLLKAHQGLVEGLANVQQVFTWAHPHQAYGPGIAGYRCNGQYSYRYGAIHGYWSLDGSWKSAKKRAKYQGTWRVSVEGKLFAWNAPSEDEDTYRSRSTFLVKPGRAFDVPYLWALRERISTHAELASTRLKVVSEQCLDFLTGERSRMVGWVETNPFNPKDVGGHWFVVRRTQSFTSYKETTTWEWLREKDWPVHDLEKLAVVSEYSDLAVSYLKAAAYQQKWWGRYHQVTHLIQQAVLRLLPSAYTDWAQVAKIHLPGGVVEFWRAPGRHGTHPGRHQLNPSAQNKDWGTVVVLLPKDNTIIELNFDPEKGPVDDVTSVGGADE